MRSKQHTLPSTPRSKEFDNMKDKLAAIAKRTLARHLEEINGGNSVGGWQSKNGLRQEDIKAAVRILLCDDEPETNKLLSEVGEKTPHAEVRRIISEALNPAPEIDPDIREGFDLREAFDLPDK